MKKALATIRHLLLLILLLCLASQAVAEPQHQPPIKQRTIPDYLSKAERKAVDLYHRVLPSVVTVITSRKADVTKKAGPMLLD